MQQATHAHSGANTGTSPENISNVSTPSRRSFLGFTAGALAIATVSVPALACVAPEWSAGSWLDRWHRLGCGARLDGHRLLQLTVRAGQEGSAEPMLAELADGRMQEIKELLLSVHEEDAAFRAVQVCRQIDTECVLSDEDEDGHEAWLARSNAAEERLAWIPARTGKGLAAKLRYALEMNGSDLGDKLVEQVLGQLERWA